MQMLPECYLKDISFPFKLNDRFFKSFSELSLVSFPLGLGLRARPLQPLSPDQTGRKKLVRTAVRNNENYLREYQRKPTDAR